MIHPRPSGNWGVRAGLVVAFLASLGTSAQVRAQAPPPPGPVASTPAVPPETGDSAGPKWPRDVVILQGAADAAEFWKKLASPDWVVTRPGPDGPSRPADASAPDSIIESVHVSGTIKGEQARVAIELSCVVRPRGPVWVPLRIDVPVVRSARERGSEVEFRRPEGGGWEARFDGPGEHRLLIEATAAVRVVGERRSLSLAIPEASSTSFDLVLPPRAVEVDLGPGEASITPKAVDGGEGLRIAAHVRPRSPLVVSWSEADSGGAPAPPRLSAQVEMAVEVDADGVGVRSSWAISCSRGSARVLRIRLADGEVASRVQLNDQFPTYNMEQAPEGGILTIPLTEPMRPGESRRLVLETRRPAAGSRALELTGYPLDDAGDQTGFLGVIHGSGLFVTVTKSQGLRRIDPRELPTALKARLGISLALQFFEQPFALALQVEESPPLYQADVQAQIDVATDGIRNETTMDIRWVRGNLFEIEAEVPPDLKIISVGPSELVESAAASQDVETEDGGRILKVRLTPLARDRRAFALKLSGRQEAATGGEVRLGLFSPRGAVSTTTAITLNVSREFSMETLDAWLVRDASPEPATARPEAAGTPSFKLRTGGNPKSLHVRIERCTPDVRRESRLSARVSRRGVEMRQETTLRVRTGSIGTLTVVAPAAVPSRWEAFEGQRPIRVEELGDAGRLGRRFRLLLDRPIVDSATLTFHYRLPIGRPLRSEEFEPIRIPWMQLEAGVPGGCVVELASEPEVEVAADDPAWTVSSAGGVRTYSLERDDSADALVASARVVESALMPTAVVPRAFVRSTLGPDGELRVRVWYAVESHPSSLAVALPAEARWLRARVDGRVVDRIELGADGRTSRIEFPSDAAARPVLVDLEYLIPSSSPQRGWQPPALLEGAEILQTYWLAEVPAGRTLLGTPAGWTDENRWAWDVYAWSRRPVAGAARLAAWAAGPTPPPEATVDVFDGDATVVGALYSRVGAPTRMKPWDVPRAPAVLACSGLAFLAALAFNYLPRAAPGLSVAAAIGALAAAAFLPTDASWMALQAAALGLLMGAVVYLASRRSSSQGPPAVPRPPGGSQVVTVDASRSTSGIGSDDSTAIRPRATSTMDYISIPSPAEAEADETVGSRRDRGMTTE